MTLPARLVLLCASVAMMPAVATAQYKCMTNGGSVAITRHTGSGGAVTIPSTTNGLSVTGIGDDASSGAILLFVAGNGRVMVGNLEEKIGGDGGRNEMVLKGNPVWTDLDGVRSRLAALHGTDVRLYVVRAQETDETLPRQVQHLLSVTGLPVVNLPIGTNASNRLVRRTRPNSPARRSPVDR